MASSVCQGINDELTVCEERDGDLTSAFQERDGDLKKKFFRAVLDQVKVCVFLGVFFTGQHLFNSV